jgi:peptidyl-prolyl cis-trans isomerase SurA
VNHIRSVGIIIFSAALIVLSFNPVSAEVEICNRVVAVVNDDVITLYELNEKIKEMTGIEPEDLRSRDEIKFLEARRKVLELLIDGKIAQEKIKELEIEVTPAQVDAAIERIKQDNRWTQEDLLARLRKQGTTYENYHDTIKEELERIRLINFEVKSKIVIREEEVRQYYERHMEQFSSEGEVHLAGIFLMRKDPEDERELQGEISWPDSKKGKILGNWQKSFPRVPGPTKGAIWACLRRTNLIRN